MEIDFRNETLSENCPAYSDDELELEVGTDTADIVVLLMSALWAIMRFIRVIKFNYAEEPLRLVVSINEFIIFFFSFSYVGDIM